MHLCKNNENLTFSAVLTFILECWNVLPSKRMTGGRFENVLLSLLQMVALDLMNIPYKNQGAKLGSLKLQNNVLLK